MSLLWWQVTNLVDFQNNEDNKNATNISVGSGDNSHTGVPETMHTAPSQILTDYSSECDEYLLPDFLDGIQCDRIHFISQSKPAFHSDVRAQETASSRHICPVYYITDYNDS